MLFECFARIIQPVVQARLEFFHGVGFEAGKSQREDVEGVGVGLGPFQSPSDRRAA